MKKVIRVSLLLMLILGVLTGTVSAYESKKTDVFFTENGKEQKYYTTSAVTVEDFLLERNIVLSEFDSVAPDAYELIEENMKISYDAAISVFLHVDGAESGVKELKIKPTNVSKIVDDYSKQTGMEYTYDTSTAGKIATSNLVIPIFTKRSQSFTTTESIDFETKYVDALEINEGVETELVAGIIGELATITRVDFIGKNEVSREIITTGVTVEPIDRVILKGTAKIIEIVEEEVPLAAPETVAAVAVQNEKPIEPEPVKVAEKPAIPTIGPEMLQYEKMFDMSATAYTADFESTGKRPGDKYFGITASGMKAQVGVVAVDPKVISLGTKLYIEGYGYAIAGDTGGAIKGNKVDLYFDTNGECKVYGRKNIKVYVLLDE